MVRKEKPDPEAREDLEGIIPEAQEFAKEVFKRGSDPEFQERPYGHSLVTLASRMRSLSLLDNTQEEQRRVLREKAKWLIQKFGPNILTVMKEEFKLALTDEDLTDLGV